MCLRCCLANLNLGRCGRQNILRLYHNIWEWELIFSLAVKAISSLSDRSPCNKLLNRDIILTKNSCLKVAFLKVYSFLGIFTALLESFVPVF